MARVGARYAELYRTRNHQLLEYATSLTGSAPAAQDLVAEAHFRVWRRLRAGHEVDSVPAYLTATVRNLASSLGRAQHEIAHDWRELPHDAASLTASLANAGSDAAGTRRPARASRVDLLTRLIERLPERSTSALWYAEVEDLPMEAVGARIGASAGTASVELTRARERLRQAFLQSQGGTPVDEACADYWELLPAIVRGTASARRTRRIARHTEDCADCRARLVALTEANSRLPLILGPALLTSVLGGGGGWLVRPDPGTVATTTTTTSASTTTATAGGGRHARVRPRTFVHVRPTVFTKSLTPARGLLVGTVGVVGAAAAIALGAANSHQATTATAVGAAPPPASPSAPALPGATGASSTGTAAAAAPVATSSNPVSASAPGSALTSASSLQSALAPPGGLLSPSSLPSSTAAASTTQASTTVGAAPSTTTSQPPTSAPATTPATTPTTAPSTSTTPSTTPTATASTGPSTPATPTTPPATTAPTTSAPTTSPTAPAVTPSQSATSAPTATDTTASTPAATPTATATPAATDSATDSESAGAVSPTP